MTDVICVDAAAQEDLMLWDQLARGLLERSRSGDRLLILTGSGEAEERRLETAGHEVGRVLGALPTVTPEVEASMRESVRTVSNRLTDEGVFAVGMLAGERGLVKVQGEGIACSSRFEERVWTGPGVLPVLGCCVADESGGFRDMHPLVLASAVVTALAEETRIVMLSRRRTASLASALDGKEAVSWLKLQEEGAFFAGLPVPGNGVVWYATHVSQLASGQVAKVH